MKKALIWLDCEDMEGSVELVEVVHRIYGKEQPQIHGIVFQSTTEESKDFFHVIHQCQPTENQMYDMRWMSACIKKLHEVEEFSCIIIPATSRGRMIAPILAMKLETGLVADVTSVSEEGGIVHMIRPAFDGKLMARIVNQKTSLVLMSVRLGVFHYENPTVNPTTMVLYDVSSTKKQEIRLINEIEKQKLQDIRNAKILIGGGGGINEDFSSLSKLAELLNGMVASSRRLVDSGKAPRNIQVGQSGKTVSPKLYMALGIYGSAQHIEGLQHVEDIIAVNTNKNAPICSLSTIVVEGDAAEFIKKLANKIIKNKKKEI